MSRHRAESIMGLCEEFAGLPIGTTVRFERGADFTTTAITFRNKLHREMRHEGFLVRSVVKGDAVYATLKRAVGDANPGPGPEAQEPEPEPEEIRPTVRMVQPFADPIGRAEPVVHTGPVGPVPVVHLTATARAVTPVPPNAMVPGALFKPPGR